MIKLNSIIRIGIIILLGNTVLTGYANENNDKETGGPNTVSTFRPDMSVSGGRTLGFAPTF